VKTATGLALLLLAPLLLVVVPLAGRSPQSCDPGGGSTGATSVTVGRPVSGQLDAVQRANAATIIDAALRRGLGREGAVIGVMTALTESSLRNLDYGDSVGPDSRGLFQQRTDWGPLTVRTSPSGASALFFGALQAIPGWRSMRPWAAAQAVQRSAFADGSNYRVNYATAARMVTDVLSSSAIKSTSTEARTAPLSVAPISTACVGGTSGGSAHVHLPPAPMPYRGGSTGCAVADPTGTGGCVTGATAHLLDQTEAAFGNWPWGVSCWDEHAWSPGSDHPLGRACDFTVGQLGHYPNQQQARMGWSLAQWYRTYAARLHVDYVIWDGRIWSTSRADEGWRRYDGGGIYSTASASGGHRDHLHVSQVD
jgi:hypothetical protein